MTHHNLLRVATATPQLKLADTGFNAQATIEMMSEAEAQGVNVIVFPEMGLTGYTCHDLFHTLTLQRAAIEALLRVAEHSKSGFRGVAVVGLPIAVGGQLFNAAAVIHAGRVLGVVPKTYLPNYKEFYDSRYFSPARNAVITNVELAGERVPFGTDILFECESLPDFVLGVEICEDLWTAVPPSSIQAGAGATVFANLSASNETIGKAGYRRQLVQGQSAKCIAAYLYASCGPGESTTDVVFGGHSLIAENGTLLAESPRFRFDRQLLIADVDLDRIRHDRIQTNSFNDGRVGPGDKPCFRRVPFTLDISPRAPALARFVDAHPFVPQDPGTLKERCDEIFHTQVCGLARRLRHAGTPPTAIGVSGGLDSTLALLVLCKTADAIQMPRGQIKALTMPGFGTTNRTLANARGLMKALGVSTREVDIRPLCLEQMKALGHSPFGISLEKATVQTLTEQLTSLPADVRTDLVFENVQARVRTSMLMNSGFMVGTGDLSELALGWCTYNADHMSMYNPNVSIPKTLVKFLVGWAAANEFEGETQRILQDIVATEISPELLPTNDRGEITQSTEGTIGPYELHDFFLYHFLRFGLPPKKLLFLASHAKFSREFSQEEIQKWLRIFFTRFFANQFKRSCMPDGPKVGSVSLSPRGDWRMPSDAAVKVWLEEGSSSL